MKAAGEIPSGEFPHGKGDQALQGAGVSREPLDVTLSALAGDKLGMGPTWAG